MKDRHHLSGWKVGTSDKAATIGGAGKARSLDGASRASGVRRRSIRALV